MFQDINGKEPKSVNGKAPPALTAKLIETVDVRVEAFLGGASASLASLTALKAGSIFELDSGLAHPVELKVNGHTVARGEVVTMGDRLAVRITEIHR